MQRYRYFGINSDGTSFTLDSGRQPQPTATQGLLLQCKHADVLRSFDLTEHEDFQRNVRPCLGKDDCATPLWDTDGLLVGWKIAPMYE